MAQQPNLLCVDDDVQCLKVRKVLLEAFGFRVTTTPDPRQALRLHAAQHFDAAVIDYQMPYINGGDLAKSMKVARPDVPVVILSGMPYLPEDTPQYYDRFYCKADSTIKLAQEIRELISNAEKGGHNGHLSMGKKVLATAGIVFGFATQGLSQVRNRLFHGPALAKVASPAV